MGGRFSFFAWAVVPAALLTFALPPSAGANEVLPGDASAAVFHLTSFDERSVPRNIGQGLVVGSTGTAIVSVSNLEGAKRAVATMVDGSTLGVAQVHAVDSVTGLARVTLERGAPAASEISPESRVPQAGEEIRFSDLRAHGQQTWVACGITEIRLIPGLEGVYYLETLKPLPYPGGGVFGADGSLMGMVIMRLGNGSSGLLASGDRLAMLAGQEGPKVSLEQWTSQRSARWSDMPYARYMRGQVAFWQGRPETTLGLIEDSMDLLPQMKAEISALLGESYLAMNLLPEAILAYRCALEQGSRISSTYRQLAWAYMETGQYVPAERMCSQIIGMDPEDSYGYMLLARLRNLEGDFDRAIYEARQALMRDPDCPCAHFERGKAYIGLGSYEEAVASLKNATTLDPAFGEAFNSLGYAYLRWGKALNAIVVLKEAAELEPEMHDAWINLGEAYSKAGLSHKALDPLSHAVCLDPSRSFGYYRLARELVALDRYEEAEETIRRGFSQCENSQWLVYYLGKIFCQEGRPDLAREQTVRLQRQNDALAAQLQRFIDLGDL